MTASGQRLRSRKKRQENQTQINNLKKLERLSKEKRGKKITTRKRVDGKMVNVSYYTGGSKKMSNIPSEGQRKLVLKAGGGGLPADYKKTEKKAFKEAEKHKKTQAKDKLKIKKEKERKARTTSTGGGSAPRGSARNFIRYKGKMIRRGTPMAKKAEEIERRRKALAAKGYMKNR
tara:strand:+ start:247 stop:771 length:525 start_codon:yes stop_codon:yes gene_type:complete